MRRSTVNAVTGCCEWMGPVNDHGYGQVGADANNPERLVHRVVWTHLFGPIADGLVIDHRCRNRRCVNPDHLEPVTRSENLLRSGRVGKWNSLKTKCPKCGGPFTQGPTQRFCKACRSAYRRVWDREHREHKTQMQRERRAQARDS